MTQIKNGGPAFPVKVTSLDNTGNDGSYQTGHCEWQMPGMSLRDYYAAHCPITLTEFLQGYTQITGSKVEALEGYAKLRLAYADEMLKARGS